MCKNRTMEVLFACVSLCNNARQGHLCLLGNDNLRVSQSPSGEHPPSAWIAPHFMETGLRSHPWTSCALSSSSFSYHLATESVHRPLYSQRLLPHEIQITDEEAWGTDTFSPTSRPPALNGAFLVVRETQ